MSSCSQSLTAYRQRGEVEGTARQDGEEAEAEERPTLMYVVELMVISHGTLHGTFMQCYHLSALYFVSSLRVLQAEATLNQCVFSPERAVRLVNV